MFLEIDEHFLLYSSTRDIWDAVRETYSSTDNTAELFAIEFAIHTLRQEDSTVNEYFSSLTHLWPQLDLTKNLAWTCTTDEKLFSSIVENKRVFQFLMGLNKSHDDVRSCVLSTKPLPTLRAAFSEVQQEESRRRVMLGSNHTLPTASETSALALHRPIHSPAPDSSGPTGQYAAAKGKSFPSRLWYDKCKKPNHTIDTCWKIHGKPADWKPARERRANATGTDPTAPESMPFTREGLDVLHKFFGQQTQSQSSLVVGSGHTTVQGDNPMAFFSQRVPSNSWIVDSGASDHMTGQSVSLTVFILPFFCPTDSPGS